MQDPDLRASLVRGLIDVPEHPDHGMARARRQFHLEAQPGLDTFRRIPILDGEGTRPLHVRHHLALHDRDEDVILTLEVAV